jgi:hypothetical protein
MAVVEAPTVSRSEAEAAAAARKRVRDAGLSLALLSLLLGVEVLWFAGFYFVMR